MSLRGADDLIIRGGRTLLKKVLKGSRQKNILELQLDRKSDRSFVCSVHRRLERRKTVPEVREERPKPALLTGVPLQRLRDPNGPAFHHRFIPHLMLLRHVPLPILLMALLPPRAGAQAPTADVVPTPDCASCAEWNAPHPPVRVFGNTYYVGTNGLGAILVTSDEGHVLIDGGLQESAPGIIESIRTLGFRIEDVRLLLNSHAHFDHAGGIAALQRASGAIVAASPASARVLESGAVGPDDPQYGLLPAIATVADVRVLSDSEELRVGPLTMTAHFTPGHTRGGTSWSWRSCEEGRCLDLVYADSQTPVSADGFQYTRSPTYPEALADFERGHALLERLRCDILLTPHPGASRLWERIAAGDRHGEGSLIDPAACDRYAANARAQLARRVAAEEAGR